jgi:hypothetical protein
VTAYTAAAAVSSGLGSLSASAKVEMAYSVTSCRRSMPSIVFLS